jgi:hypothetical protein
MRKGGIVVLRRSVFVVFCLLALVLTACQSEPTSTTGIIPGHIEISTQGKTYVPIEHFVYSLHDGVFLDGKWFDKMAIGTNPNLKVVLDAAEAIPYANDFTFLRVWDGQSEEGGLSSFRVFDDQMEPVLESESLIIPPDEGLYYVSALLHLGNDKEYIGLQYIFKVVRDKPSETSDS